MAHLKADYNQIRDWSIYKITSPSNRTYVGLTSNVIRRRKDYSKVICKSQSILYKSLKKYGYDSHSFEVIDNFSSNTNFAYGKEMFWIRTYMCNRSRYPEVNGLNAVDGGRGNNGYKVSDETKEKLRQANFGKKYSEETKAKLSKLKKGKKINRIYTQEQKAKMRIDRLGKPLHTEETKKRIGEAAKGNKHCVGRKLSPERVEQMRKLSTGNKYNVGKKHSESHKKAISDGNKGKRRTAETIAKIKESKKNLKGKGIIQYTLDGSFIKKHISIRKAAREIGISRDNIKAILKGSNVKTKTFIFKYQ